ncbi:hypothetical protein D3C87_1549690 [compost metagenome]
MQLGVGGVHQTAHRDLRIDGAGLQVIVEKSFDGSALRVADDSHRRNPTHRVLALEHGCSARLLDMRCYAIPGIAFGRLGLGRKQGNLLPEVLGCFGGGIGGQE